MNEAFENILTENIVLSIIIPVYNVECYIGECLESCLTQDIDNYEILCIDDGSPDRSGEILDRYAAQYDKIRVFHKENGGVSSARNFGAANAKGKWIWFVDPDDYIAENCCKAILDVTREKDVETVVFDHVKVKEYQRKTYTKTDDLVSYHTSQDAVLSMGPKKNYSCFVWAHWVLREKLVREKIEFDPTMKYAEDTCFVFQYKFSCTKGAVFDYPVYYYRQRAGSAYHNLDGRAHAYCMERLAQVYDECLDRVESDAMRERLLVARSRAVRASLFDHCFYVRDYAQAKEALTKMQDKGWYPYKVRMGIYSKSLKGIIINVINECLRYKWFYLLVCKVKSKR
ncbi:MAG: glycosyltransferase family 2 protein [Oscillospiraceae bacterium]|nr:glycosyltransferase family 2 protein [Oscillospiraceae bacterium]